MKCLVKILGLYDVFSPSSHWKCCWCKVHKNQLANFNITEWKFRDAPDLEKPNEWKDLYEELEKRENLTTKIRSNFASANFGIKYRPLINLPLESIIPCNLHCVTGIVRLLLHRLVEAEKKKTMEFTNEMNQFFGSIDIELASEGEQIQTRVANSSFKYPEWIRILRNQEALLSIFRKHSIRSEEEKEGIEKMWKMALWFITESIEPSDEFSATTWRDNGRVFGKLFTNIYDSQDVTPYLHVLVYHLGGFIEKYGSLERYANFATESWHRRNKDVVRKNGSSWGNPEKKANITMTQIANSIRRNIAEEKDLLPSPVNLRGKHKPWWDNSEIRNLKPNESIFQNKL